MVPSYKAIKSNIVLKRVEAVDVICGLTNTIELEDSWVRGSLGYLSLNEDSLWFLWRIDIRVRRMLRIWVFSTPLDQQMMRTHSLLPELE